jgi:nucleoside-diphosphate-sugar epimerase
VHRNGREDGDVMHTGADIERARAELGFDPETDLTSGLEAELEWAFEARRGLQVAVQQ